VTVPASRYSRVTLVGDHRRVDLVLPATEPIGSLMPDLLVLLGDEVQAPPRTRELLGADGDVLAPEATLAEAAVEDGAVLRLVARHDAPPAPVVHVIEEVSDDSDARAGRWGPAARRWTVTAAVVVGLLAVAWMLVGGAFPGLLVAESLAVLAVAACAAGFLAGRASERAGAALTLAGGAVALVAAWTATGDDGWPVSSRLVAAAAVLAAVTVLLGLTSSLGRAGLVGGGLALLLAGGWGAGVWAGLAADRLAALLAVACVVLLGLLPRLALTASGLSALDDRRTGGAEVGRRDAVAAVAAAHRGLEIATVATAAAAVLAGYLLLQAPTVWSVPLTVSLGVVLASRARVYPLAAEVVALLAASAALLLRLLAAWLEQRQPGAPGGTLAVLLALVAAALVALAVEPPEHVRARLRRLADRLEAVAVVAAIPLAIGVFGIYGQLLDTF
jgi:type VII secretion integral membrane protein EccD